MTPHLWRRMGIHSWFVVLIGIIILMIYLMSCATSKRTKDPCKGRRGMSGYGYGILEYNKSNNGISVVYIDNANNIFALDYLTKRQYDSLKFSLLNKSHYAWIKCRETKKVFILDKEGAIACSYTDTR